MLLENSFDVPASPDQAWDLLMDMPRVIPCMPGATLEETLAESSWRTRVDVRLGPVALVFAADVDREEADREAMRAVVVADARETRGRGAGKARIESSLVPQDAGTRVIVRTDLTLSGAVAQTGRGIVQAVSAQLIRSFADCLAAQLGASAEEASAAVAARRAPVKGHSLALRALADRIERLFRRRESH
jgi:carbon monoxide dehydrogenase subunit G